MPQYQTLDLDAMKRRVDDGKTLVINVLGEDAYRAMHIPGSENVPVDADDFGERIRDMAESRETPIVVYCADADCQASPKAAERLTRMGFRNVFEFKGGLQAWKDAGLEVEGEKRTIRADL